MIEQAMILVIAVSCTAMPLAVAQWQGVIRYASPMHVVAFLVFFGTTLKVIIFGFSPVIGFFYYFTSDQQAYVDGLNFVFLFVLLLCVGYAVARPVKARNSIFFTQEDLGLIRNKSLLLPLALGSAIAVTGILLSQRGLSELSAESLIILNSQKHFNVNSQGIGATGAMVKVFFTIPKVIFILAVMIAVVSKRRSDWLAAALIGGVLLGASIVSGDRFELLRMAGFGLIAAVFAGWRASIRSVFTVAALCFAVIALAAAMSIFRQGKTLAEAQNGPLTYLVEQMVGSTYFMDVNMATIVIDRMDQNDQLMGASYMTWTYGWIPRAIWPDKPAVDVGIHIKREIVGESVESPGGWNATGPGEAYINFGWYGCLVGLALGVVIRHLELFLLSSRTGRGRRIIFYPACLFLVILSAMQSSLSGVITAMFLTVPLTAVTVTLFLRRKPLVPKPAHSAPKIMHASLSRA